MDAPVDIERIEHRYHEHPSMTQKIFRKAAAALAAAAACTLLAAAGAHAFEPQTMAQIAEGMHNNDFSPKVEELLRDGRNDDAAELAEIGYQRNPSNVKLKFLRAVALDGLNRQEDAAILLREITRSHPEIPEPYNNLAVIEAGFGNLEEAQRLLKKALQLNPKFALARKNLADIYLSLAREGYEAAAESFPANKTVAKRLKTLNELLKHR